MELDARILLERLSRTYGHTLPPALALAMFRGLGVVQSGIYFYAVLQPPLTSLENDAPTLVVTRSKWRAESSHQLVKKYCAQQFGQRTQLARRPADWLPLSRQWANRVHGAVKQHHVHDSYECHQDIAWYALDACQPGDVFFVLNPKSELRVYWALKPTTQRTWLGLHYGQVTETIPLRQTLRALLAEVGSVERLAHPDGTLPQPNQAAWAAAHRAAPKEQPHQPWYDNSTLRHLSKKARRNLRRHPPAGDGRAQQ